MCNDRRKDKKKPAAAKRDDGGRSVSGRYARYRFIEDNGQIAVVDIDHRIHDGEDRKINDA